MAWNGSNSEKVKFEGQSKVRKTPNFNYKALFAGLIVVLIGSLIVWLVSEKPQEAQSVVRKAAKPTKISVAKQTLPTRTVRKESMAEVVKPEKPISPWRRHLLKVAEKDPQLMFQLTNKFECVDKRTFGTTVEQSMDWMFNCQIGDAPMPLLGVDDADPQLVERVLRTVNEIKDKDTDDVKNRKDSVMRAKIELAKFLKEGGEYKDFMRYYHNELVRYHEIWTDAQDAMETFTDSDASDQEVMAYYDKVNKMLTDQGIRELELSDKIRDRLGLPEPEDDGSMPPVAEFKRGATE